MYFHECTFLEKNFNSLAIRVIVENTIKRLAIMPEFQYPSYLNYDLKFIFFWNEDVLWK